MTRAPSPAANDSLSASLTCPSVAKKLDTWPSLDSCDVMAAFTPAWLWPSEFTAMPASKST